MSESLHPDQAQHFAGSWPKLLASIRFFMNVLEGKISILQLTKSGIILQELIQDDHIIGVCVVNQSIWCLDKTGTLHEYR